jgi:outer membrane receptor protein involved in Fe transport
VPIPKRAFWLKSFLLICFLVVPQFLRAQTTGKIAGQVFDANSKESLSGANVIIEGSTMGAAAGVDGSYYIINIPPGNYTLRFQMMGYKALKVENVQVSVNRTTSVDASLNEAVIEGQVVVVQADKATVKKDQTSSVRNVSADQIDILPVENIESIISMQAGVVDGHFRGGRSTEVSYLVDGVQTDERFDRDGQTVEIETDAVQDMEIITGTFNAEYGRAMSGIVNLVTKDGGTRYTGSFSGHVSNFISSNSDVFIGQKNSDIARNQDYKITFSGPIYRDRITFFVNYRFQDVGGYLNGINRFEPDNYTNFIQRLEPLQEYDTPWDALVKDKKVYSEHTGDSRYVSMEWNRRASFMAKLSFKLHSNLRFSLMTNLNGFGPGLKHGDEWQEYSHASKYKPLGRAINFEQNVFYLFSLNHLLNPSLFYDIKLSFQNHYRTAFLYEDPFDEHYVSDGYERSGGGFVTGGQEKGRWERRQKDFNAKFDLTWQLNKSHSLKTGVVYTQYNLVNNPNKVFDLRSRTGDPTYQSFYYDPNQQRVVFTDYQPSALADSVVDDYEKEPFEYAFYIQDKMEFDELVINLGLRYDYFDANTLYPTDIRNPDNLQDAVRVSDYAAAKPQKQISPRFGLSYTLGEKAILHFSYGHFFQMPPFFSMYQNNRFRIPTGDFETVLGNPNIKAERTAQYEMGLWQELLPGLGIDVSVFYRDIYDLQSAIVVTTYSGRKFGVYSNKDYGNVKGMELKLDYISGPFSFYLNYTLQYTRGVADNPNSAFDRLGQSIDPISRLTQMSWDQRHTANFSVGYNSRNWGTTVTTFYNSGLPYTYRPIAESTLAKQDIPPNAEQRPANLSLDLKSHYDFKVKSNLKLRLYLSIYNLLDTKNELIVNPTTGRAYTAIIRESDNAVFRSNYNDIYDSIKNPAMYSPPREVKLGLGIRF